MARTKLTTACSRGDSRGIYEALRYDMAKKLEATESGRDYAAIAKSFIDVQEKIDAMQGTEARAKVISVSPLACAQSRHLKAANGG